MFKGIVFAVVLACVLTGCKSQGGLAAEAVGCGKGDVEVIKSQYSREGSTTAWCAKCKSKIYHCVSNPDRSRVVCKEANPWDACN